MDSSPVGLHRVVEPPGVLPQAAERLDPDPRIRPDEVRVRLERLNLDAASYRQLHTKHGGDPGRIRAEVLEIVRTRGKMHNPVTGSGGMLIGVVDEIGPRSPLGLRPGARVATLVSLTLTPLRIDDGLARWDGRSEQVPAEGHAILFARSIAAELPADLPAELALAVLDVCGAPALTGRVVGGYPGPSVTVIGAAGKSGSLALAAARRAGAKHTVGVVPNEAEAAVLRAAGLADAVVVADARDPIALAAAVSDGMSGDGEPIAELTGGLSGGPLTPDPAAGAFAAWNGTGGSAGAVGARTRGADVTVVCVDVPGCEHGAILATNPGGTVIFFSMATSFSAAALGAEGLAADVTMLIGNGYVPGHADLALELVRTEPGVRELFHHRLETS